MTRRGECAPRCLPARTLGVEWLEGRWLLSRFGTPTDPQSVGLAVEGSPVSVIVSAGPTAVPGDSYRLDASYALTVADAGSFSGGVGPAMSTVAVSPLANVRANTRRSRGDGNGYPHI